MVGSRNLLKILRFTSHQNTCTTMSQSNAHSASSSGRKSSSGSAAAPAAPAPTKHGEDRLAETFRTLVNCFIAGSQKAEKVDKVSKESNNNPKELEVAQKELHNYVFLFLRTRVEYGRLCSYLEAKIEGTAQEMETIQHYHRTTPTLGSLGKRKREDGAEAEALGSASIMEPAAKRSETTAPPSGL